MSPVNAALYGSVGSATRLQQSNEFARGLPRVAVFAFCNLTGFVIQNFVVTFIIWV